MIKLKADNLSKIEALIFSARDPVSIDELSGIVNFNKNEVKKCIQLLQKEYNKESHGITLKQFGNRYIFKTKHHLAPVLKKFREKSKQVKLSKAALETLAIIAYKQPVTRSEIEEIRGVKAEKTLLTLSKYNLIKELGRKETIGNPIVYGTTGNFLEHFDLKDLSQLPDIENIDS